MAGYDSEKYQDILSRRQANEERRSNALGIKKADPDVVKIGSVFTSGPMPIIMALIVLAVIIGLVVSVIAWFL